MMKFRGPIGATLVAAGMLIASTAANAQSTSGSSFSSSNSSGRMWGSASSTGTNYADSSVIHAQDGTAAGQVNAAKQGLLYGGGAALSITAIGSQNIVSTSVIGNGNSTNVNATQTSSNLGTVTNNGTVATKSP